MEGFPRLEHFLSSESNNSILCNMDPESGTNIIYLSAEQVAQMIKNVNEGEGYIEIPGPSSPSNANENIEERMGEAESECSVDGQPVVNPPIDENVGESWANQGDSTGQAVNPPQDEQMGETGSECRVDGPHVVNPPIDQNVGVSWANLGESTGQAVNRPQEQIISSNEGDVAGKMGACLSPTHCPPNSPTDKMTVDQTNQLPSDPWRDIQGRPRPSPLEKLEASLIAIPTPHHDGGAARTRPLDPEIAAKKTMPPPPWERRSLRTPPKPQNFDQWTRATRPPSPWVGTQQGVSSLIPPGRESIGGVTYIPHQSIDIDSEDDEFAEGAEGPDSIS